MPSVHLGISLGNTDDLGDSSAESVVPTYDCVLKMGQFVSQSQSNRR